MSVEELKCLISEHLSTMDSLIGQFDVIPADEACDTLITTYAKIGPLLRKLREESNVSD